MHGQHLLALALLTVLSCRAHGDRLSVALDDAARSVEHALAAFTTSSTPVRIRSYFNPTLAAAAREDCAELLEDSLHLLAGAGVPGAARDDALAWLSAALTSHDTCADGLAEAGLVAPGYDAARLNAAARASVRDTLAMLHYAPATDGGCVSPNATHPPPKDACGFPRWTPCTDRWLLSSSPSPADLIKDEDAAVLVVAQDGTGTHSTIAAAVDAAPECSHQRTVIYVRAGLYDEVVKVGTKKTNLVFVGDGAGRTVVTGNRSAADNITTFQTATFAASGFGFMMVDMTVQNTAGPARRQAVALRVSADRAAVHRCAVLGYQDTLYVHKGRQFYRGCDVRGTVDFVFGNAAAVLQRCALRARVPLPGQGDTVTAQSRRDPCEDTGIVLHGCRVVAETDDDLSAAAGAPSPAEPPSPTAIAPPVTYLGRPWKAYSRVVVMDSYIGPHVAPEGWMPWNASTFALDTLYYAEYINYGPGARVAGRVSWRGHRVINATEAESFTVARFIAGTSWLPATGISFVAGLLI